MSFQIIIQINLQIFVDKNLTKTFVISTDSKYTETSI